MKDRNPLRLWAFLITACLLIGGALFAESAHTPPLYDGIGFPDEPYRYLIPPPGALKTRPPQGVSATASLLGDGSNAAVTLQTVEKGPQIALAIRLGLLQTQPGAHAIRVEVEPSTPVAAPANGTILGNTYRITFTADTRTPVSVNAAGTYTVSMRIPQATRQAVAIEYFQAGLWTTLRTQQTGIDVYAASVPGPGSVAAVLVSGGVDAALAAKAGSGGSQGVIIVLAVVVIVAAGVVAFTVRVSRTRTATVLSQPPADQISGDMGGSAGADGPSHLT